MRVTEARILASELASTRFELDVNDVAVWSDILVSLALAAPTVANATAYMIVADHINSQSSERYGNEWALSYDAMRERLGK